MNEEIDDKNELPSLNDYKYQHLNKYSGDEFINAFVLEMIIRIVEINNLMTTEMIFENLDFTIENGNLILGDNIQENSIKEEDPFSLHFGLTSSYLANLFMMHPYHHGEVKSDLLDFTYNFLGENIMTAQIDLDLSEDELTRYILELKRNYEESLNPLEKLHIGLKSKIKKMLKKMPDNMKIKEQNIIKALFIYDYVQARKKQIDSYNNLDYEDYQDNQEYKEEAEEKKKEDFLKYPHKNTKKDDSFFKEKGLSIYGIKPGTAKTLYYYLDPILTKYHIK